MVMAKRVYEAYGAMDPQKFMYSMVCQPKEIREVLIKAGDEGAKPGQLISLMVSEKKAWLAKHSKKSEDTSQRWWCGHCGNRPYVEWDVCRWCGSCRSCFDQVFD